MEHGIFYVVSVGAGNPLDMTLRAEQTLKQADCIILPVTKAGGRSTAYEIAAQVVELTEKEKIELVCPMQRQQNYRELFSDAVLSPITTALQQGKKVAMVTLGDASVYSTASYVRQRLQEKGYSVNVIPGIPSFCAGAAEMAYSLCENTEALAIIPGTAEKEQLLSLIEQAENSLILKASSCLEWLLPYLEQKNLLSRTIMMQNIGMSGAYIGIPTMEHRSYFTTLLIKKGGLC